MGISIQQMREYVWGYFELEEEEMPAALLDRWAEEGLTRVYRHIKRWPHYEADAQTITTAADTQTVSAPLPYLESIHGENGMLKWMEHSEAKRMYETDTGQPEAWSVRGGNLYLWPIPDGAHDLEIEGYRGPNAFTSAGAGSEPDLPEDFHQLVLGWVMHRAYQQQDDFEGAQLEHSEFDSMLGVLTSHETQASVALPVKMGGNRKQVGPFPWRLAYEWE